MPYKDPEAKRAYDKAFRESEAYKLILLNRRQTTEFKESRLKYQREYVIRHREELRIKRMKKRHTNEQVNTSLRLRSRIRYALRHRKWPKSEKTVELLGCTFNQAIAHIESQFKPGMNWGNVHIDHIMPCAVFNLTVKEERLKCFNYKNLQPLWPSENLKKGSKCLLR